MIVPVILSGGEGRRLWPLSSPTRPKQFLTLTGEETLLQQTIRRIAPLVAHERIFTVTHCDHRYEVVGQLHALAPVLADNVLAEPEARNTLPAIAWGAARIAALERTYSFASARDGYDRGAARRACRPIGELDPASARSQQTAAGGDAPRGAGHAPPARDGRQLAAALTWSLEHLLYVAGAGDDAHAPPPPRHVRSSGAEYS